MIFHVLKLTITLLYWQIHFNPLFCVIFFVAIAVKETAKVGGKTSFKGVDDLGE